jgi:hypothetical protein
MTYNNGDYLCKNLVKIGTYTGSNTISIAGPNSATQFIIGNLSSAF